MYDHPYASSALVATYPHHDPTHTHRSDEDAIDHPRATQRPGQQQTAYPGRSSTRGGWIVGTKGQPCTSRCIKRAVFSQWAAVLEPTTASTRAEADFDYARYGKSYARTDYQSTYGAGAGDNGSASWVVQKGRQAWEEEDGGSANRNSRQLVVRAAIPKSSGMSVVAALTQRADAEAIKAQQALKLVEVRVCVFLYVCVSCVCVCACVFVCVCVWMFCRSRR
jgi:hypothetical protein